MTVHKNIFTAVREGNLEEVEKLLKDGADLHATNAYGKTALILAAEYRHTEIVNALLAKEAQVDTKNLFGYTALTRASQNGHTEVKELLLKNTQDIGTLIYYGMFIKAGHIIGEKIKGIVNLIDYRYRELIRAGHTIGKKIISTFLALGQKLSAAVSSIKNIDIDSLLYLLCFASFSMMASIMTLSLVVLPLVSAPAFAILMATCIIVHYAIMFRLVFVILQFPEITVASPIGKDGKKAPIARIVSINGAPIATPLKSNNLAVAPPTPSAPTAETGPVIVVDAIEIAPTKAETKNMMTALPVAVISFSSHK
tara:strand:+ start:2945 stop:3877 length:933 start_codon:yes stop_codon:yes gene_type:complete